VLPDPLVPVDDPEAPDLPVPVDDPDVPVPVVSECVSVFVIVPDLRFRRVRRFFAPALPVVSSVPDMVDPAVPEAAPLPDVFPAVEFPLRVRVEPAFDPDRPV
jgi:hypothetical protein